MRFLLMISLALFGPLLYGGDFAIPLENGSILIRDSHVIRVNQKDLLPVLSFTILNSTSAYWDLEMRFDIIGRCNGEERRWSRTVQLSLHPAETRLYKDVIVPLMDGIDGCVDTGNVAASLISAENPKLRVDGITGERLDLEEPDAAYAARRKRLAAEQRRKQTEADARLIQIAAEQMRKRTEAAAEAAEAAEERRTVQAACTVIYQNTIDSKVKDLTVREEQQVRACQALGLYRPQ